MRPDSEVGLREGARDVVLRRVRSGIAVRGHTLLELMIAVTIVATALLTLVATMQQTSRQESTNERLVLAVAAADRVLAHMRGLSLADAFHSYDADPDNDPAGPGTAPGVTFEVPGLQPIEGVPVGRVVFPTQVDDFGDTVLTESFVDPQWGMAGGLDLNLDGAVDVTVAVEDCFVVPVRLVLTWQGEGRIEGRVFSAILGRE